MTFIAGQGYQTKFPGPPGSPDGTLPTYVEYLELGAQPKPGNTFPGSGDSTPRPTGKQHIIIERCINNKLFRALATRYGERNCIYLGTIDVTTIKVWLRDPVHDHGHALLQLLHGSNTLGGAFAPVWCLIRVLSRDEGKPCQSRTEN